MKKARQMLLLLLLSLLSLRNSGDYSRGGFDEFLKLGGVDGAV